MEGIGLACDPWSGIHGTSQGNDAMSAKLLTVNNAANDKEPTVVPNLEYGPWLDRDRLMLGYL
jgi:hypothetical protein